MFEIKLIVAPVEPSSCECRGYAGTSNNLNEPGIPSLPELLKTI